MVRAVRIVIWNVERKLNLTGGVFLFVIGVAHDGVQIVVELVRLGFGADPLVPLDLRQLQAPVRLVLQQTLKNSITYLFYSLKVSTIFLISLIHDSNP